MLKNLKKGQKKVNFGQMVSDICSMTFSTWLLRRPGGIG